MIYIIIILNIIMGVLAVGFMIHKIDGNSIIIIIIIIVL